MPWPVSPVIAQYSSVDQGVARHHGRIDALLLGLARDQTGLGVIAAEIDQIDAGVLHLGDQRGEVLVARGDRLVHGLLDAARVQLLLELVGEALAVGRLVVDDRDLAADVVVDHVVAGEGALLVVATAHPEDVFEALLGQLRIGRGRRDLQDAFLVVDRGRGDRGAGAEMPGHEHDPVVDHLVGDRDRLLRIAGIVADLERQLLAEHAALGVEVLDRHLGAALHLIAEDRILSRHRSGGGDRDLRLRSAGRQRDQRARGEKRLGKASHVGPAPWLFASHA